MYGCFQKKSMMKIWYFLHTCNWFITFTHDVFLQNQIYCFTEADRWDVTFQGRKKAPLRKLRRQYLRYQQAENIYSISHKKLFELASDAGAIYRIDGTVLINRDIFDDYLERFHEPATGNDKEKKTDER